jgi:excisionase family DNA binding protein
MGAVADDKVIKSEFLSLREAAERLRCSKRTIQRRVQSGDLQGKLDGKRLLIYRISLENYVWSMPTVGQLRQR